MDPRTRRENWTTATGGRLKPGTVSDGKNLFFVTSFEDEQNVRIHTLNSISLQTGLLVWRKRFTEEQDIVLYAVQDEKHIFLSGGNKTLYSIDKAVGNISWKQEFPAPVISFDFISKNYLSILTEDGVYRVDVLNGMIPESWRLNGKPFNRSILKAGYMFLGYPTGEVAKIASDGDRNETLWKIKTGGSIAGLYELEDGVLAASMDNFLYLFTTESGNLRWKRRLGGRFNIKPLIYGRYAVVLNSSDNQASVIELNDGKVVNRIMIEDDNYFLNEPSVIGGFLVLQTFRGIYFFVNTDGNCQ
jgi:outer membrane protein assembly factor BamB